MLDSYDRESKGPPAYREDRQDSESNIAEGGISSEEAREAGMGKQPERESGHESGRSPASAEVATDEAGHVIASGTNDDDISQRNGYQG